MVASLVVPVAPPSARHCTAHLHTEARHRTQQQQQQQQQPQEPVAPPIYRDQSVVHFFCVEC